VLLDYLTLAQLEYVAELTNMDSPVGVRRVHQMVVVVEQCYQMVHVSLEKMVYCQ
jgi:hypothetical protein